ncbi:MAG: acetylglutamate kinase [Planctomycetaceae bacterium]
MDEAIRKAKVLIEALSWIQRFRGRYVVVKIGGSTLDDVAAVDSLLTDVVFMATVGMKPVIVHGGGKAISAAMGAAGIEPTFVAGRRFTDQQTLQIASRVLVEDICQSIVDRINSNAGRSTGLHFGTENVLTAEKLTLKDDQGNPVDLGHVGHVTEVDIDTLIRVCSIGAIPVIPSIALSRVGHRLNVNADTAAAAVARALSAEKLIFLSDIPGILTNIRILFAAAHVTAAQVRALIADGTIAGEWFPRSKPHLNRSTPEYVRSISLMPQCGIPCCWRFIRIPVLGRKSFRRRLAGHLGQRESQSAERLGDR